MFYGIVVYLYYIDNNQHHLPHIHAKYQNDEIIVSILDGKILDGKLPPNKLKLLLAWMVIHKEDLIADWNLAVEGQKPYKIDPLR
jgi:hypothetical protein